MIKRIGVLTSGGDAPGMNAAIRAVTRTALELGWEVMGVRNGYSGLVAGEFVPLNARSVGRIIQVGGTMLGSARCLEFKTDEGREKALHNLAQNNVDALVVIGGNGSQTGAYALFQRGFPVNGVASTIDNDLAGSDMTIGVDTALNVALESIDRLKTTASSHQRAFLIEVMGRNCGYLALMSGIAGGAEAIVIPEFETTPEQVADIIEAAYQRGKSHAIVVVAEGATYDVNKLARYFADQKADLGFELRAVTIGHVQRGGAPFAYDRILGSRLGACAVEALHRGEPGVLAGSSGSRIVTTPLAEIAGKTKPLDKKLLELAATLAR
jgi:6-phosphofructokinase 1